MIIALSILTGVITGILSGMLGIGGGAVMVALAISFLHISQHAAQAAALAAIIPTALTGVAKHHKNKLVNYRAGMYLAIGGMIGGFGGSYIANMLNEAVLQKVFSIFFAIISIQLFISSYKKEQTTVLKNEIVKNKVTN